MEEAGKERNSSISFNTLSNLFREYSILESKNFVRLQSVSFSDLINRLEPSVSITTKRNNCRLVVIYIHKD